MLICRRQTGQSPMECNVINFILFITNFIVSIHKLADIRWGKKIINAKHKVINPRRLFSGTF